MSDDEDFINPCMMKISLTLQDEDFIKRCVIISFPVSVDAFIDNNLLIVSNSSFYQLNYSCIKFLNFFLLIH